MVQIDGERLRQWRERRLLTLRALEAKSGVRFHTIHAIETGKQAPRISTLKKLLDALEIGPDEVMPGQAGEETGKAAA